ncbi:MAG: alpha/beta hydrolase fold domain-containing protein [Phycisphaera sp.]|nr:alpha/beta hydrolase fold domain-containing protein [Phycisphaera sp.]
MSISKTVLFVMVLLCATHAATWAQDAPTPTKANVAYGKHPKQVLDFYQAKTDGPAPLLFFVRGGGWMVGDKAKPDFLKESLAAGISVVSINYRFINDAIADKVDPPVKACLEDAKRALQFVRHHAKEWNIDPTRVCGCGGSAGGFTTLWLAFHDDMADAKSDDPIARESTRLTCAMTFVPQTSLDPKQMRDWIPNIQYGPHAFGLPDFDAFLAQREKLMPWIKEFSPYELASKDDPPVFLFYDSPLQLGQPWSDPPHSANFGGGLAAHMKEVGAPFEFYYKDQPWQDLFGFIKTHLKVK